MTDEKIKQIEDRLTALERLLRGVNEENGVEYYNFDPKCPGCVEANSDKMAVGLLKEQLAEKEAVIEDFKDRMTPTNKKNLSNDCKKCLKEVEKDWKIQLAEKDIEIIDLRKELEKKAGVPCECADIKKLQRKHTAVQNAVRAVVDKAYHNTPSKCYVVQEKDFQALAENLKGEDDE